MVTLKNKSISDAVKCLKGSRIVFFGCGSWSSLVAYSDLMKLKENFVYAVDNSPKGPLFLLEKKLEVFTPEKLRDEQDCVVIITGPVYMYDMYEQLVDMQLQGNIQVYAFPLMQMVSDKEIDEVKISLVRDKSLPARIPKVIHSFWFSGDEKPEMYQKCIDTWAEVLTDYKIIEWNMDNYDWHKNPFLESAINNKAWAFASDFARLDVLYEYGGIYMDMDIEVFQPFDDLLGNKALLSFGNNVYVDLAFLGAERYNPLIASLLQLYDDVEIPTDKAGFSKFFQPSFVCQKLVDSGVKMDGSLQFHEQGIVFPRSFFMPQETVCFFPYEKKDYTYCVHHDNFGWSETGQNKREKKIRDNRKLWSLLEG